MGLRMERVIAVDGVIGVRITRRRNGVATGNPVEFEI